MLPCARPGPGLRCPVPAEGASAADEQPESDPGSARQPSGPPVGEDHPAPPRKTSSRWKGPPAWPQLGARAPETCIHHKLRLHFTGADQMSRHVTSCHPVHRPPRGSRENGGKGSLEPGLGPTRPGLRLRSGLPPGPAVWWGAGEGGDLARNDNTRLDPRSTFGKLAGFGALRPHFASWPRCTGSLPAPEASCRTRRFCFSELRPGVFGWPGLAIAAEGSRGPFSSVLSADVRSGRHVSAPEDERGSGVRELPGEKH